MPGRNSVSRIAGRLGRRLAKRPAYPWTAASWDAAELNITTAASNLTLIDYSEYIDPDQVPTNGKHQILRFQFKGAYHPVVQVTTFTSVTLNLLWALYVNDLDDNDTGLWSSSQNAFINHQIIRWGHMLRVLTELPSAQLGEHNPNLQMPLRFETRRPIALRPDQRLVLTTQLFTDISTVCGNLRLSGVQRAIVKPALSGR